jgi:hypothetical protein
MAFKFPCDMTEAEQEAYHAQRFDDERRAGAKRFGLRMDEVLFYNRGICYDRIIVTTMRAAQIVAASVAGETVNGGYFDGMPLGGITEATIRGVKGFDVRC